MSAGTTLSDQARPVLLRGVRTHWDAVRGNWVLLAHYDFANEDSMAYFTTRLRQAPRDVAFGLRHVLDHADTPDKQDAAAAALEFKTDLLWAQLDALYSAYVTPGNIPPGTWIPGEGLIAQGAP